ncbi:MAG: hypothetical protein HFI91_12530 [Lachnospiraceae bacterium]|jgi:hypothetical protein|nr:hypothetical protein [Lachnospiraceae bacterium]
MPESILCKVQSIWGKAVAFRIEPVLQQLFHNYREGLLPTTDWIMETGQKIF